MPHLGAFVPSNYFAFIYVPVYNDALHLASAKVAGEPEFITGDVRQRAAALLMGFRVLP